MDENQTIGGARPALAAHSKDASAHGQTSASSTTAEEHAGTAARAGDAVRNAAASAAESIGNAAETISSTAGRTVDQAAGYVREQPLVALATISVLSLALGMLLGRRST